MCKRRSSPRLRPPVGTTRAFAPVLVVALLCGCQSGPVLRSGDDHTSLADADSERSMVTAPQPPPARQTGSETRVDAEKANGDSSSLRSAASPASPVRPDSAADDQRSQPPAESPGDETITSSVLAALQEEAAVLGIERDVSAATDAMSTVRGAYLRALQTQAIEFDAMGWRQVGVPAVDSIEVIDGSFDQHVGTVQVWACIDASEADVVDEQGNSLRGDGTPSRSANIYTLEYRDGIWAITHQTFADDPNC